MQVITPLVLVASIVVANAGQGAVRFGLPVGNQLRHLRHSFFHAVTGLVWMPNWLAS